MNFTQYLQQKRYRATTIDHYTDYTGKFLSWLQMENIDAAGFTYNDLLSFMKYAGCSLCNPPLLQLPDP
jgi:hypothetical protein